MLPRQPIRVLHVLKQIMGGGVESWLLHVMRNMDRDRFQMDLLARVAAPSPFDDAYRATGARIHYLDGLGRRASYDSAFREIVRTHGPYDVVHCHSLFNNGLGLILARRSRIPVRIAHSHLAHAESTRLGWRLRLLGRCYRLSHSWTEGIGCSGPAGREMFGPGWGRDSRYRLLFCGVDMEPFHGAAPDPGLRADFGLPEHSFVVGHVGRFVDQKNHPFLIEIATEACRRDERIHFLLLGEGGMQREMQERVLKRGLAQRIIFAGQRSDAPKLMAGAMDAFCLPSLFEGLGLVGVEAQAAGLRVLVSDTVPTEMDAVPALVKRMSLSRPAAEWAEALLEMKRAGTPVAQIDALATIESGPFNIHNSVASLQAFYEECLAKHRPPTPIPPDAG
jgi:glycosyltransferase involved in cell wall biosynthesis